jgi:hypothetical protein
MDSSLARPAEAAPAAPSRTVIVVVCGVGDEPSATGAQTAYRRLLSWDSDHFLPGDQHDEWFPNPGNFGAPAELAQPVTRFSLRGRNGAKDVDLYEFYWADQSRFPSATRSFVMAAYSLFLHIGEVGRAALRGGDPLGPHQASETRSRRDIFRVADALLATTEWVLAVPIVLLGLLLLGMLGGGLLALRLGNPGRLTYATLIGYAVVLAIVGGWWLIRRYSHDRFGASTIGLGLLGVGIGLAVWRTLQDGGDPALGIADAIAITAAYLFRGVWIVFGTLAAALFAVLAVMVLKRRRDTEHTLARAVSTVLSLGGAFGVALLTAVLYATLGVLFSAIGNLHFARDQLPLCLANLNDWQLVACRPGMLNNAVTADAWGKHLFGEMLAPLAFAGIAIVGFAIIAAAIAFVRSRPWRPMINHVAPIVDTVIVAVVLAALISVPAVVIIWLPLGFGAAANGTPDSLPGAETVAASPWPALISAVTGYAVLSVLAAARFLNLGLGNLAQAQVNTTARGVLDTAGDVLNFLREPSRLRGRPRGAPKRRWRGAPSGSSSALVPQPRQIILGRFAALMSHITKGGGDGVVYDRVVFFAHSQGTVLTTALLSVDASGLELPPECGLITFGCPLRNLLFARVPGQFGWVADLAGRPTRFVRRVNVEWVNFGSDGDFVGRTLFTGAPRPPTDPSWCELQDGPPFPRGDRAIGAGGHGTYWETPFVYQHLSRLARGSGLPFAEGVSRSLIGSGALERTAQRSGRRSQSP